MKNQGYADQYHSMRKTISATLVAVTVLGVMGGMLVPVTSFAATKKAPAKTKKTATYKISISAIPGADEKSFDDATTRCLTKDMKATHAKTVSRMEADIKARGEGHTESVSTYKEKIDLVWSAMEQPYCGYGSRGMEAVKHSYTKSIERIRAEFLAATKPAKK